MFLIKTPWFTLCRASLLMLSIALYAVPAHAQTATQAAAAKAKRTAATRAAAPNATPIDVAINKSEHMVMLSQRAVKLYVRSALGITPVGQVCIYRKP